MLQLYVIIGIITVFIYVRSATVLRNAECIKQHLLWIYVTIGIVIWPVLIGWVIYKSILELINKLR